MFTTIIAGINKTSLSVVGKADTALHYGSGLLDVYGNDTLIGTGTHMRYIINEETFLKKILV